MPRMISRPTDQLTVLMYDDRYNASRDRHRLPLFRALDAERIPFIVGRPEGGGTAGVPGVGHSAGALYNPADKVSWLMRELPQLESSQLVFLTDTDTTWFCSAREVKRKRSALLASLSLPERTVVVSGEKGMWPPYQEYRGVVLRDDNGSASVRGYPPASASQPFRFLNAGAALGRPRDVLAMLRCMAERYEDFPRSCPAGHDVDGRLQYYASNSSWRPPQLTHRRHSRYHYTVLAGAQWGWEQACFHMYYLEHLYGELPAHCPPVTLDREARWVLHLAGVSLNSLVWDHETDAADVDDDAQQNAASEQSKRSGKLRAMLPMTGQRPCVVHANGPAKHATNSLWSRWEKDQLRLRPAA